MLHLLVSTLGILITIFFVIGTHESAHFMMARLLGVKVLRFSIGFGKTLFRFYDKRGVEYVIALIPLGGYVKMLDETDDEVAAEEVHRAYNRQPFYKKCLIVAAGPLCNILCALILYWFIFMLGFTTVKPLIGGIEPGSIAAKAGLKPNQEMIAVDNKPVNGYAGIVLRLLVHTGDHDTASITTVNQTTGKQETHILNLKNWQLDGLNPDPLASLGILPYQPPIPLVIGKIAKDSPAATAGFQLGDKILALNGQAVKNWEEIVAFIVAHPEQMANFKLLRQQQTLNLAVRLSYQRDIFLKKSGYLGIGPEVRFPETMLLHLQYGPIAALSPAWNELYDFTYFNILLMGKLITGKLSLQSLGGPITIFDTAGDALNIGLVSFLGFLAFLSISIGIINILPLPGLDGGHLFIQLIEFIIRRPIPDKCLAVLYRMSFMLIFCVLMIALMNDVLRLF